MKRSLILLAAVAALSTAGFGQRVETIPFRAVLSSANEIPPVTPTATGAVNVFLHIVRDNSGNITSGSVDFAVNYRVPAAATFTAMHIHRGTAAVNGGVVIDSALPRTDATLPGGVIPTRQAQIGATGAAADAVAGILADPGQFYFNLHTTDSPGGLMRGQLQRAQMGVFITQMSPANEVPAITPLAATTGAIGTVTVLRTFDSGGNVTSGWLAFDVNYRDLPAGSIVAMHVHTGPGGVNGPVTLDSGMTRVDIPEGATGNLRFENEMNVASFNTADALNRIFDNPGGFYLNTHTTYAPGGYFRGQLRPTDKMEFQMSMSPANEVPPVTTVASAPSRIEVRTIRNPDGTVAGGVVIFDTNPRAPQGTTLVAMHIHDQVAGVNGPVSIDSALARDQVLFADGGVGNITKAVTVSGGQALASLNSLVLNPERHYYNIHSTTNPGGVVRAQLAGAAVAPKLNLMISAITDINQTRAAPGSLMRLFGDNMMRVSANVESLPPGANLPTTVNGTTVTMGGIAAPILASSDTEIVAQVPVEMTGNSVGVTIATPGGTSAPFTMPLAANAPNIFFDSVGGFVLKNNDFSLVRPANAVRAGDILLVYATGLGQTTPPQPTGRITPNPSFNTAAARVTIGGVDAPVIYSIASPGFVGLTQTAIRVPAGLPAGNRPLVLSVGTAASNTVQIAVQ